MNKELKGKWLTKLRSGRYRQGDTFLRSASDEYCCLGVLLSAAGFKWGECSGGGYVNGRYAQGGENQTELTAAQLKRFGVSDGAMGLLMDMNDNFKKSFAEIADHIEETM